MAKRLLLELGEFHPFAIALNDADRIQLVGAHVGDEYPTAESTLVALRAGLSDLASRRKIIAAAICSNVRVERAPGVIDDAVGLSVANVAGDALDIYLPYHADGDRGVIFGQLFAAAGDSKRVFGGVQGDS